MRNQAIRGDFTKYGMLQQYRTGLDSEPVRSIVQTAVSSALNAQRDAYDDSGNDSDDMPNMG